MVHVDAAALLARGRAGDPAARGELLDQYRNFLHVLARSQIDRNLRARCDASDLVQETLMEAHRDFPGFAGSTEKELVVWLRRILVRNLADQVKRHKAQARDLQRQESLEALLERSCAAMQDALARGISSPSAQACRREEAVLLADALARLPPDVRAAGRPCQRSTTACNWKRPGNKPSDEPMGCQQRRSSRGQRPPGRAPPGRRKLALAQGETPVPYGAGVSLVRFWAECFSRHPHMCS